MKMHHEYISVCMCAATCMHAPQQLGDAYGTCIHPLTAVTLVNKADYVCFRLGYNIICYFSNYAIKSFLSYNFISTFHFTMLWL